MKNPIVDGYYADPESRVYDGTVYMYVTKSLPFEEQHNLDLVTTSDLEHFEVVHDILDIETFHGATFAIWAPTEVYKNGKHYLIFAACDIHEDGEDGGLYLGVSDSPRGPFVNAFPDGRPLLNTFHFGAQPIDAHLFLDTDGTVYLYYGGWRHLVVCKFNEDMTAFAPLGVAGAKDGTFLELTPEGYVEAPYVERIGEKIHLLYSTGNWMNGTYAVCAAVADTPLSPFVRYDTILTACPPIDGPGHNSAFSFGGKRYVAYHRRLCEDKNPHHRTLAIDSISTDGARFHPVKMT